MRRYDLAARPGQGTEESRVTLWLAARAHREKNHGSAGGRFLNRHLE